EVISLVTSSWSVRNSRSSFVISGIEIHPHNLIDQNLDVVLGVVLVGGVPDPRQGLDQNTGSRGRSNCGPGPARTSARRSAPRCYGPRFRSRASAVSPRLPFLHC